MAEGDSGRKYTDTAGTDKEIAPGTAKASPISQQRLPEDGATVSGRSTYYAGTNQKDVLPEHTARRNVLPHIHAG